uniref:large neutral amino acids transporter small subunit 2-like n=1 Tax=Ciona intestinalis TaxID=7719 RepID=UPI000EF4F690|nr:large neutral amino acids transporter small subunit 2-like [Ciona intestinalis]|eukprot:XP_026696297.1 large neutral amino acids transporter small subunit 2-like [Ciona intestinalis]
MSTKGENENIPGERLELKKKIGFWGAVAFMTSATVGSGIFVSPGGVVSAVHGSVGLSMVVWVTCGLVALLSALCYCELGVSIKASGGDYANFQLAYGRPVAYMYIVSMSLLEVSAGITLQVFVQYLLSGFFGTNCALSESLTKTAAICVLLVIVFMNYRSVRSVVNFEIVFTVGKFLCMGIISIVGIVQLIKGNEVGTENFKEAFSLDTLQEVAAGDIALAIYQGIFSYNGWMVLNFVMEEIIDVEENLPKAVMFSLSLITLTYLCVNVGYFSVLTVQELATSPAVAVTFANKVLGPMAWIIPVTVCVSTLGNQNAAAFLRSRFPFVAARSGMLPKIFTMIHVKFHTPGPALILTTMTSVGFILIGDVYTL